MRLYSCSGPVTAVTEVSTGAYAPAACGGPVARLARFFEAPPSPAPCGEQNKEVAQYGQPWKVPAVLLRRALLSPLPADEEACDGLAAADGSGVAGPAGLEASTSCSEEGADGSPPPQQPQKRQRVWCVPRAVYPPLPALWSGAQGRHGNAAVAGSNGASAPGGQLWPGDDLEAREARLAKIRARFGTKVFYPAKQLPPAELRRRLGASEADLTEDDYKLYRWDALPVLLSQTSNAYCNKWVLSGQSGCVGLASSLTHLFVLGAGQTIYLEEADAVRAVRDEVGVYIQLGAEGSLTVKVPDAELAATIIAIVNDRAATRQRLRCKYPPRAAATAAAVAETASDASLVAPAAVVQAGAQ